MSTTTLRRELMSGDLGGGCIWKITQLGGGGAGLWHEANYELWWTDSVANDWTETYGDLPTVLCRLAVLAACADNDFELFFANEPVNFAFNAEQFLAKETRP